MGAYDSIRFKCPSCNRNLEAQSKSGACLLRYFNLWSVPLSVARGANRHAPFECECGKKYSFEYVEPKEPEVTLLLREV